MVPGVFLVSGGSLWFLVVLKCWRAWVIRDLGTFLVVPRGSWCFFSFWWFLVVPGGTKVLARLGHPRSGYLPGGSSWFLVFFLFLVVPCGSWWY